MKKNKTITKDVNLKLIYQKKMERKSNVDEVLAKMAQQEYEKIKKLYVI